MVNVIVISVVMFGIYGVLHLQQDVMPQADLDMMRVTVTYPGASPSDVELNAIVPVEREVAKISGLKEYTSLSLENGGTIVISIDSDVDDKQSVKDEVFRNITLGNIPDMPSEVEDIRILDINPKVKSIYCIARRLPQGKCRRH